MATAAKSKEKSKDEARKRYTTLLNRKARHEYEIEETYVTGMVLTGTEIKSVRLGLANLQDSFCRIQNGEVWVNNFYIAPYEQGNRYNVEPRRSRKLLLHKWQIVKLTTRVNERGLSIIPTKLFLRTALPNWKSASDAAKNSGTSAKASPTATGSATSGVRFLGGSNA